MGRGVRRMDVEELREWEARELERVKVFLDKMLNKPEMSWEARVRIMYPEISFEKPYAYRQDLGVPIKLLLPFYNQLIFHVDSFRTKDEFKRYHDMLEPEELARLYNRGRVRFILASSPTEYAGLDYLDPILQLKPPTVLRMRGLVLSAVGSLSKFSEYTREGEQLFSGKIDFEKVPGLYASLRRPRECVEGHVISSYVNLCCMGYEKLVRDVIELNGNLNEAAKVLVTYDSLLVRPLTTGMLGQPQITKNLASLAKGMGINVNERLIFPTEVGQVLVNWYGLDFPLKPEVSDIEELYKENVMNYARRLLVALEDVVRRERGEEALERVKDIKEVLKEAQETILVKMEGYKEWIELSFLIASIGSQILPGESGLLISLMLEVASHFSDRIAESLYRLRAPPLQMAIWDFKKRWDKVRP
jgi:hypothetical protein